MFLGKEAAQRGARPNDSHSTLLSLKVGRVTISPMLVEPTVLLHCFWLKRRISDDIQNAEERAFLAVAPMIVLTPFSSYIDFTIKLSVNYLITRLL